MQRQQLPGFDMSPDYLHIPPAKLRSSDGQKRKLEPPANNLGNEILAEWIAP